MEYKCLIFCCLFLQIGSSIDQASFYGNSYISVPFKEAKSSTDITFKFRTYLSDALILLVAGTTDYCIVEIENSRIKVIINLGAGESELISPQNAKFNDYKWHEVVIERREANLSLAIDKIHKVQKHLPGKFFELNIHYGLFIGDHKSRNNTDMFFGHVGKFRGCLSELKYNGLMVLEQARRRQSQSIVQGVTWNCAAEFEAGVDRAISFVEDDSFVVIPQKILNKEIRLQFDLRTIVSDGLLFYNTGKPQKPDYFSIELNNYTVKAIIRINDRVLVIGSAERVSDGEWHKVSFRSTTSLVELTVDDKRISKENLLKHNFQFTDSSYLGGLEVSKRFRASSKGCSKCDISFKGCIRHFMSMDVKKGLPDAHVSEGILPGCMWHYPCLQNPCTDNGTCVQQGLDSFQCHCKEELCVKVNYTEGYKVFSKNSLATELELLAVEPLEVIEGQNQIITTNNLHMILDYQKYGIKDTGINFYIVEMPEHGSITIDIWPHEKNSFTLSDIGRDKIYYVHDGSENTHDSMVLEVEFSPADTFILPVYLQGKFRFSLLATIVPKNDPPLLDVNESTVFRIVQGTKKLVSSSLLQAIDPDNTPSQLVYNILKSDSGYFENVKKSGVKITTFTQEDIDKEKIMFFDKSSGINDSQIALQISDGIETSPVYTIRVSISPQYWRLENNTGLIVLHQTSSIITPFNLSFTSNVGNVDYRAQFNIIKKPHYGVIEIEKYVNSWELSDIFNTNDLKQHRVRYRHFTGKPEFDEFQFKTSFDKTSVYTFRINFVKCTLYKINMKPIVLNEFWETPILTKHLSFETQPLRTLTSIDYVIVKPPVYGYLFSAVSKYRLRSCDMFKQEDLVSQNIKYKLHQRGYSYIEDSFSFIVLSPGCNNVTGNLTIKYLPSNDIKSKVKVNLLPLTIEEGSTSLIDTKHLYLETDFISELLFNVTEKPKHGILQVKKGDVIKNDTTFFTIQEIRNNLLYYIHDGSETIKDQFKFLALSANEQNFQFVEVFHINIQLTNDNSPTRVVDKIFHIVVGGDRLLTGNDLKYTDLDLGTPPASIVYTCKESQNGNFYNIKNQSTKINEFSQEDLDNNRIIFKHKGPEYGKVRLWVTDGKFHVNGILEIQASAPFIHAIVNEKIIVQQNKLAVITKRQLTYSTNLFASDSEVIYEIVTKPHSGKLVYTKTLKPLENFTQEDINLGHIGYLNENSRSNDDADEIYIRIRCKDAVNLAQLGVWILPSVYWEPLQVKNIKKLSVEESTSALITKKLLEVVQPSVPASSIIYHINEMPDYGYVTILTEIKNGNEPINIVSFSQDMVNENKILYVQSTSNQTKDRILFNVTNGIVWHTNLKLNIEIIPERIYMSTNPLLVNENGVATITTTHIYVLTDYYKSKITSYLITKGPQFGCILVHKHCIKSNMFSQKELVAGVIKYQHHGTENHEDEIEIVAKVDQKNSIPVVMKISVVPVNNLKPKLVNNTGLTMWEGGIAVITNDMLAAIDEDKPPDTLKYQVQSCWWGTVALLSDVKTKLNYFTQEFINKRMVVFRHENGTEARFKFNISDGLHTTKDYMFHIVTKPVEVKLQSRPLHIFPLQRKYLTSSHLHAIISDPERMVYYEITTPPTLGRLMMDNNAGVIKVVSSFTQDDLNNSRVYYEHTHQFSDLYANDSFVFNVKANLAPTLTKQVLKIDISVSSGGLDAYVNIPKITVDEGATTNIILNLSGVVSFLESHAGLRAPIIHASASPPQHGQVFLQNNQTLTTFTQQQLESGLVYYEHDHSDSLGDNIHFSLYLLPGYIILCNLTVPITINPINDQPFNLITPAPRLTVVQGENHTITRYELATEDADTPPEKLKYIVISPPSHGKLVLAPEKEPIMYFTQANIDDNRLMYIHEGSVLKDSFHFRVWDEKFRPEFTLFNIMVIPINITISAGLPVFLQQGSDVVYLTEKQFFIETNADKYKIKYSIKKQPKHGALYVNNDPTASFTQVHLRDGLVMYLQRDMTTANDTFTVYGEINTGNTSYGNEIEVLIKVQPLMQINNFTVLAGDLNKISLLVLDATPLSKLTLNSNPRYTILQLPQYGKIRKIIRSSGEKRIVLDAVVSSFSHEEIQSGLIYLDVKDVEVPWNGLQDRLVFMLAASIFQPAVGELKINVRSSLNNELYSTLAGPSDPAGHEGGLHLASPNMTRDYLLIVSMVVGVIVLGIAVIIIIKCRALEVEELNKEEQCMQPIPLPRPPDRLMSSSPPLKQHMDGFNNQVSTALPQCKVTPLSRSDIDSHACYPYGVEEQTDDWSSCDASDPPSCPSKNIMLRRNQYWV